MSGASRREDEQLRYRVTILRMNRGIRVGLKGMNHSGIIKQMIILISCLFTIQKFTTVSSSMSNIGCRKEQDLRKDLKEQFFESIKAPQEPFMAENYGLGNLSHLISSSHDWKNIQEVVRIAFKYVSDSFYTQQNQLKYLFSELSSKASKSELSSKLSSKFPKTFNRQSI